MSSMRLALLILISPLCCIADNNKVKSTNDPDQFLKDHLFFCTTAMTQSESNPKSRKATGCRLKWYIESPNSQNIQNLNINDFTIYNKKGKSVNIKKTSISDLNKTKQGLVTFDAYFYKFTDNIIDEHRYIYFPAVHKKLSITPESVELTEPKIKLTREEFMKKYYPQLEKYQKDKELRRFFNPQFNEKLKVSDFELHKHKDFDLIYINRTAWDDNYCTYSVLFVTKEGKVIVNNANANYARLRCEEFRTVTKFLYNNNLYYAFFTNSVEHETERIDLIMFNKKGIPEKLIQAMNSATAYH